MLKGHGGEIYTLARERGVAPEMLLDFSSNTSPLPLPEGIAKLLVENIDQIGRLPEVDSAGVRMALAGRFCMDPCQFLVSGGTTQWIHALPRAFHPKRVIVPIPTYSDYTDAAQSAGVPVLTIKTWKNGLPVPLEQTLLEITDVASGDDLVFVCNPNNPTGTFAPPGLIADMVRSRPEVLWIIDESYAPFVKEEGRSSLLGSDLPENCLVLRSFSKIFGIPGLRLGYVAGERVMLQKLQSWMQPWQVNRLAQLAGEALAGDYRLEEEVRCFCMGEKERLAQALDEIPGLEYLEGAAHFMLFRLGTGLEAAWLYERLLEKNIVIRNCDNFEGFDQGQYVRISPGLSQANSMLINALNEISELF